MEAQNTSMHFFFPLLYFDHCFVLRSKVKKFKSNKKHQTKTKKREKNDLWTMLCKNLPPPFL